MVHIKGFVLENGRPKFAHVGEGMFNYKPVLKYLKENKPYVTMLLENSNADRYHSDVEYLQKIYSEV